MNATLPRPAPRYHRWPAVLGIVTAIVLVIVASCEVIGWPFLAEPVQRWLSNTLQRQVSVAIDGHTPASVSVRLLGRLRLEAPQIEIAAPSWSQARYTLHARDAVISLHYTDLWRAHRGEPLRIHMLEAAELDAEIERLADGRASWQFGLRPPRPEAEPRLFEIPLFDRLKVDEGTLRWNDERSGVRIAARFGVGPSAPEAPAGGVASALPASTMQSSGTRVEARGTWRGEPVAITLRSEARLPWVDRELSTEPMRVMVDALVGDTRVSSEAMSSDALSLASAALQAAAAGRTTRP